MKTAQLSDGQLKHIQDLAVSLTLVPGCPQRQEVVDAIAEDLIAIANDVRELEGLAKEARGWKKWQGKAGLIELAQKKRGYKPLEQHAYSLGPKPAVKCELCQDWGYTFRNGRNEYCSCPEGAWMKAQGWNLIEKLNAKKINSAKLWGTSPPPSRELTQADLDRAAEAYRRQKSQEPKP